jgi:hypothetical protein
MRVSEKIGFARQNSQVAEKRLYINLVPRVFFVVLHSSLIIFLLSYVLLRMPIRSTLKGDSFSLFNMLNFGADRTRG